MPNSHVERNGVQFIVPSEIELEGSVVLMPGTYEGRTTHLGYIKHEETVWMPKRYWLLWGSGVVGGDLGSVPAGLL